MTTNGHSISLWISILHRYRRSFVSKKLERYGTLGGLYLMVLTLHKINGASQEQISDFLKIDKAAVARSVRKLEREGYVFRETDCADKRANKVYLTPKAVSLLPAIQSAIAEWDALVVSGLPEESRDMASQLLRQMAENACQAYPFHARAGEAWAGRQPSPRPFSAE